MLIALAPAGQDDFVVVLIVALNHVAAPESPNVYFGNFQNHEFDPSNSMLKVSNEKKNLSRLAGEFLVASRLSQRGYMVALQWGTTIGYDILVFDKVGHVAFVEVKASASHPQRWLLQKKFAAPSEEAISKERQFVCCVDLTPRDREPDVYVFPASVVANALNYFYSGQFSRSPSFVLALNMKPRHRTREENCQTVGDHIGCHNYLERFEALGINSVVR
ncbi:MAG TPA: hypothetical protein VKZ53_19860 [Candidatus Angelobacter sp.]|nr:hypothetical protein [Candidatus Angelobacter sp.]